MNEITACKCFLKQVLFTKLMLRALQGYKRGKVICQQPRSVSVHDVLSAH